LEFSAGGDGDDRDAHLLDEGEGAEVILREEARGVGPAKDAKDDVPEGAEGRGREERGVGERVPAAAGVMRGP
jgi:hypothetical protein